MENLYLSNRQEWHAHLMTTCLYPVFRKDFNRRKLSNLSWGFPFFFQGFTLMKVKLIVLVLLLVCMKNWPSFLLLLFVWDYSHLFWIKCNVVETTYIVNYIPKYMRGWVLLVCLCIHECVCELVAPQIINNKGDLHNAPLIAHGVKDVTLC